MRASSRSGWYVGTAQISRASCSFDAGPPADAHALVELEHAAGVMPAVPADAQKANALAQGAAVTVVGFGGTAPADLGARRRRAGTSIVLEVGEESFKTTPSPAVPCGGDSGGAALLDVGGEKVLVGVVSSGSALCDSTATFARVDATRSALTPQKNGGDGGCSASSSNPTGTWLIATGLLLSARSARRCRRTRKT
jgi:hypothetical protein